MQLRSFLFPIHRVVLPPIPIIQQQFPHSAINALLLFPCYLPPFLLPPPPLMLALPLPSLFSSRPETLRFKSVGISTRKTRQSVYGLPKRYNTVTKASDWKSKLPNFDVLEHKVEEGETEKGKVKTKFTTIAESSSSPANVSSKSYVPIRDQLFDADESGIYCVDPTTGEPSNSIVYMGIIDILQLWNVRKRAEHTYKSIRHDAESISAVDPATYAKRFQDFMTAFIK